MAEIAVETDTNKFKVGDGVTAWNALAYGGVVGPTGPQGPQGVQGVAGTNAVWTEITQAAYNALSPPNAGTLYVIVG